MCATTSNISQGAMYHGVRAVDAGKAAVPTSKSGGSVFRFFGGAVIRGLIREAKMSFSSELENLTLDMTRPNSNEVPGPKLEQLYNIVGIEYDNPEVLVSILVKLSRKFAEKQAFTQLKTMFVLHTIMHKSSAVIQGEWAHAILSMCGEKDEKTKCSFFDNAGSGQTAGTAAELRVAAIVRSYQRFVTAYLQCRAEESVEMSEILRLISLADGTLKSGVEEAPAVRQVMKLVVEDRDWALQRLQQALQSGKHGDSVARTQALEVLRRHGLESPVSRATVQPVTDKVAQPTTTHSESQSAEQLPKQQQKSTLLKRDLSSSLSSSRPQEAEKKKLQGNACNLQSATKPTKTSVPKPIMKKLRDEDESNERRGSLNVNRTSKPNPPKPVKGAQRKPAKNEDSNKLNGRIVHQTSKKGKNSK